MIQIPLVTVNQILSEHFRETSDLVSLAVQGTEYEILTHFDFFPRETESFLHRDSYLFNKTNLRKGQSCCRFHGRERLFYVRGYLHQLDIRRKGLVELTSLTSDCCECGSPQVGASGFPMVTTVDANLPATFSGLKTSWIDRESA